MLPLAGSEPPNSPETLVTALKTGLAARELTAKEVTTSGTWPALDSFMVDLTGVQVSRSHRVPTADSSHPAGFCAARFELVAAPASLESTPVQISLHAKDAEFEFASSVQGEFLLMMKRTAQGDVTVEVARTEIERLLQKLASEAAGPHGVEIKSTSLQVAQRGPRAVSLVAEITAKMFIAKATMTLTADLDLDDQLNLRPSNLQFHGDGMVASLAGGFIRPQLARLEGRAIPLVSFALGDMTLRDIQVNAGETLRFSAQFGI